MDRDQLYNNQIHYELFSQNSEKDLIVLVHPLGMNHRVWQESIKALESQYDVLVLDLPGHGESPAVTEESWTIPSLADMIRELVFSLGYSKVHYVGTSIGGAIGQELLLSNPEFLQSLMVTNTSYQIGTKESWTARANDVRNYGIKKMAAGIVPRWFAPEYISENRDKVEEWQNSLAESDNEGYAILCEALGNWSATTRLEALESQVPVLAVAGDKDPAMPLENMKELASLLKAPLEILDLGHVPSVEDPKAFNELLLNWLEKSKS